jgi:hypothetical protein
MADTLHEGLYTFMSLAFVLEQGSVFCEEWVQVVETVEDLKIATERDHILCEVRNGAKKFSWPQNVSLDTFECK